MGTNRSCHTIFFLLASLLLLMAASMATSAAQDAYPAAIVSVSPNNACVGEAVIFTGSGVTPDSDVGLGITLQRGSEIFGMTIGIVKADSAARRT